MTLEEGYAIAKRVLREQYGKEGIYAGATHFKDVWARDSFFASLGALALEDYAIVKTNLESFLSSQKRDGQIPIRIGRNNLQLLLSFIGLPQQNKTNPIFSQDKGKNYAVDPNSLLIIAFMEYYNATHNTKFLNRHLHELENAVQWFKPENGLIKEGLYAGWADSIKKQGYVLYSNVCYAHALFSLSELFTATQETKKADKYLQLFEETKKRINKSFWNGSYYMDWIDDKPHNYFSTDGNLLAIIWDIANKDQSKSIEEKIEEFNINSPMPSLTNYPEYSAKYVSPFLRFMGLKEYHNGLAWAWLGALDAIAKSRLGLKKEAKAVLEDIAEIFVKYKGVYEVYRDRKPVRQLFYKSENNFAWSAGLFIVAYKTIILIN